MQTVKNSSKLREHLHQFDNTHATKYKNTLQTARDLKVLQQKKTCKQEKQQQVKTPVSQHTAANTTQTINNNNNKHHCPVDICVVGRTFGVCFCIWLCFSTCDKDGLILQGFFCLHPLSSVAAC